MRKRRVRVHLVDRPGVVLPSVEGVLLRRSGLEYVVAEPSLLVSANSAAQGLSDATELRIPAGNVAFYEVLR